MLDEGYAAVSVRRVAKMVGLTSALVHYYFPTTDDLFVAFYRSVSDEFHLRLMDMLNTTSPVEALWSLLTDAKVTGLGVEFIALANHRKAIQTELVRLGEYSRRLTAKIIGPALKRSGIDPEEYPELGVTTLIQAVARTIVMDRGVGMTLGIGEATVIMSRFMRQLASGGAPAA